MDKIIGEENLDFLFFINKNTSSFIINDDYFLFKSTFLDSGSIINIFNDLLRF